MSGELPPRGDTVPSEADCDLCEDLASAPDDLTAVMDAVFGSTNSKRGGQVIKTVSYPIIGGYGERTLGLVQGDLADDR